MDQLLQVEGEFMALQLAHIYMKNCNNGLCFGIA